MYPSKIGSSRTTTSTGTDLTCAAGNSFKGALEVQVKGYFTLYEEQMKAKRHGRTNTTHFECEVRYSSIHY